MKVGDLVATAGGFDSLAPADIPIGRIIARMSSDGAGVQPDVFDVEAHVESVPDGSVTVLLYVPSPEPGTEITATNYIRGKPIFPIDLLEIPPDYYTALDEAVEVLTRECMTAQGFSYLTNPGSATLALAPAVRDAEYRRRYGFGQPPLPAEPDRVEFMAQLDDPAWLAAWQGTDHAGDGCSGEAMMTVHPPEGVRGPAIEGYGRAVNDWRGNVLGTRQVVVEFAPPFAAEATADWAECMTALGYSTTSPSEFATTTGPARNPPTTSIASSAISNSRPSSSLSPTPTCWPPPTPSTRPTSTEHANSSTSTRENRVMCDEAVAATVFDAALPDGVVARTQSAR